MKCHLRDMCIDGKELSGGDGDVRSGCINGSKFLEQLSNYELINDLLHGVRQWSGWNICRREDKE